MPRSELLSITEKDRLKEDKEVFFEIKDRLELNHEYKCLDLSCYSCGKSDHLISDCPFIHYVIKPEELLKMNKNSQLQFKQKNFRKKGVGAKSEFRVRFWRHIGSVPKNAAEKDLPAYISSVT